MTEETIELVFENKNLKALHRQIRDFVASVPSASVAEIKAEEVLDDQNNIINWKGTLLYQVPKK